MRYPAFKLVLSLFLVIFFYNCNRNHCPDEYLGSFNLTTKDRAIIPYVAQNVLIFKSNVGDTILYSLDTIESGRSTNYGANYNHPECLIYYNYEYFRVILKDITKTYKIDLVESYFPYPNLEFVVKLSFSQTDSIADFITSSYLQNDSIPGNYYPSFQIGERYFLYVHELFDDKKVVPSSDFIHFVYYTTKQGIVGFKSNKGKFWYLVN